MYFHIHFLKDFSAVFFEAQINYVGIFFISYVSYLRKIEFIQFRERLRGERRRAYPLIFGVVLSKIDWQHSLPGTPKFRIFEIM